MKLGYLTSLSQESILNARKLGYDSLEVGAGWLTGPSLAKIEADLPALRDALTRHHIGVNSVAIYGDAIAAPVADVVFYYERAIKVAQALDCAVVSGMTGRDNRLTVAENLPLYRERFEPISRLAEDHSVRIAFEPWPGGIQGHGPYHWTNIATTPELWDRLFEAVPSASLGLEYDPSHLIWQGIDHLQAICDYGSRIYHIHAKDIVINQAKLKHVGVHGTGWWRFVLPGLGQIDWPALFKHLRLVGYSGDIAVEHEDNTYLGERWNEGLAIGLKTLRPLVSAY
jgi:sugar phosphate isomerase/epimerase